MPPRWTRLDGQEVDLCVGQGGAQFLREHPKVIVDLLRAIAATDIIVPGVDHDFRWLVGDDNPAGEVGNVWDMRPPQIRG